MARPETQNSVLTAELLLLGGTDVSRLPSPRPTVLKNLCMFARTTYCRRGSKQLNAPALPTMRKTRWPWLRVVHKDNFKVLHINPWWDGFLQRPILSALSINYLQHYGGANILETQLDVTYIPQILSVVVLAFYYGCTELQRSASQTRESRLKYTSLYHAFSSAFEKHNNSKGSRFVHGNTGSIPHLGHFSTSTTDCAYRIEAPQWPTACPSIGKLGYISFGSFILRVWQIVPIIGKSMMRMASLKHRILTSVSWLMPECSLVGIKEKSQCCALETPPKSLTTMTHSNLWKPTIPPTKLKPHHAP